MTMIPRPPGQEFQSGYLPEWVFWPQASLMPDLTTPPPTTAAQLMPDLAQEAVFKPGRGSSPAETAAFYGQTMKPWSNDLAGQEVIATEPGIMSVLGLSTGTAYDALGRGYDTINFDAGAALGGLAGGMLGGPLGSALGGWGGRQADWNYALVGTRNPRLDFGRGLAGLSRGEIAAFREARDAVMNRPMPQNLTSTERGRRQAAQTWGPQKTAAVNAALAEVMAGNSAFGSRSSATERGPNATASFSKPGKAAGMSRGSLNRSTGTFGHI